MITAETSSAPPSFQPDGRLGPRLERMHRQWLRELRARVEHPKAKERNIWARWEVIRYVDTEFSRQFDQERNAIGRVAEGPVLWVAGELVANLLWQLRNNVGLCHHGTEFSSLSGKLIRAVEYWFTTVEDVVGATRWADLSPEARQELGSLGIDLRSRSEPHAAPSAPRSRSVSRAMIRSSSVGMT
jgi:hypothetical protein